MFLPRRYCRGLSIKSFNKLFIIICQQNLVETIVLPTERIPTVHLVDQGQENQESFFSNLKEWQQLIENNANN